MNRAQKALAENIVLSVRNITSGWSYHEKSGRYDYGLDMAIQKARQSMRLEKNTMRDDHYANVILNEINDCIRIARTYHDLTSEEIIESLDVAHKALR